MTEEKLNIYLTGSSVSRFVSHLFCCHCCKPSPSRLLSLTLSQIPEGAQVTMSTGTPVNLSLAVNQKALGHLAYVEIVEPPKDLTAVSDNPSIVVTQNDDTSFFVGGDGSTEATGNVTFTDGDGNSVVVTVTTTAAPPPPTKTLGITFDAPVSL